MKSISAIKEEFASAGEGQLPELIRQYSGDTRAGVRALTEKADGMELAKLAAQYADGIIMGCPDVDASLKEHCSTLGVPVLPYEENTFQDGSYMDRYNAFYDDLLK